jgi:hypothetical protein
MTTPFDPVNFDQEALDAGKLQKLSNNVQYLFDNAAKIRYKMGSIERTSGVKILTGRAVIPIQKDATYGRVNVYFNNYFTSGCRPIVVATPESLLSRLHVAILGLSNGSIDHTGFRITTSSEYYKSLDHTMYIHWIAVGY